MLQLRWELGTKSRDTYINHLKRNSAKNRVMPERVMIATYKRAHCSQP